MRRDLVTTTNSLADIVTWLKNGYIVCIYSSKKQIFFFKEESLTTIEDEILIYINVNNDASLIDDEEWPWYIKNEGFVEYKSTHNLPTNEENIYSLKL